MTTTANGDGEYFTVGDTAITVCAKKFSTYAIGYTEEVSGETPSTGTPNRPSGSSWVSPAMEWAVERGILTSKDGDVLDPQGRASRGEAAAMLIRFCESTG